jgi:predicted phage-related endonuclease
MIADEELRLQIATMARLKEGAKQLAGEVKVIEAEVKKSMRESAVLVDELGVELVTWRTAKPSTKLDTKRLKAEQPELAREFSIEVPGSRRFLIK